MNLLYNIRGGLYIGFHGCDKAVRDQLLLHPNNVAKSTHSYDWLGTGFYVWEGNLGRAQQWAEEKAVRERNKGMTYEPSVLGVVYELGHCLDLMDSGCIEIIQGAYGQLKNDVELVGGVLPVNRDLVNDPNKDILLRDLDCAILNYACAQVAEQYKKEINEHGFSKVRFYDTVRGCFTEGAVLPDTQIYEKTHIQIAIRNLNCIKGFFLPREELSIDQILSEYEDTNGADES